MGFENLTIAQQTIEIFEYEQKLKSLLIIGFFALSLIYIFLIKPNLKETPFFSVGIWRIYMFAVSWAFIVAFPFEITFFMPDLPFSTILMMYSGIYSLNILFIMVFAIVDMPYFSLGYIFNKANLDMKNKRIKDGLKWLFPNKKY